MSPPGGRIPAELRQRDQWVVWKHETGEEGKPIKPPYRADGRGLASSTDPSAWTTFETALKGLKNGFNGIGFAFTEADPFTFIDLDHVVDEDRDLHPSADKIVRLLGSYTEVSQSGSGLHVLVRAKLNGGRNRTKKTPWKGEIEIYDRARFAYLTGDLLGGHDRVEDRQAQVDELRDLIWPAKPSNGRAGAPALHLLNLSDHEVLERAFAAANGSKVEALYRGNTSGYDDDDSRADLALCSALAFWTGPDPDQLDRLIRASGLMRSKWERPDYRHRTISKALEGARFYNPAEVTQGPESPESPAGNTEPDGPANAAAEALQSARVNLVQRIDEGIPERDYVPGGEGWLLKGKRHLVFAPAGVGKTLGLLVVAVEAVERGGRVSILDLENGGDEYARRLDRMLTGRAELKQACTERLCYFEYPALSLHWDEADWVAAFKGDDLVVIDSSRVALSSVGLSEDSNDDYAQFMNRLVVPLSRSGVTTTILDNTGHEGGRTRGASAKADLNEVVFELRVAKQFGPDEQGELVWRCTRQRFGGVPKAMKQRLGGGVYELPEPTDDNVTDDGRFRPTVLMERISRYIENYPGSSQRAIRDAGLGKRTEMVVQALRALVDEGYVDERPSVERGGGTAHFTIAKYREDEDNGQSMLGAGGDA